MRLNKAYIEARFERIATLLELDIGPLWTRGEDGINRANVGVMFLDNTPIYGGWQINQMANETGGQRTILPRRMRAAELDAWFAGAEFGWGVVDRGE